MTPDPSSYPPPPAVPGETLVEPPENVGRGLAFSLIAVVVGAVLAAVIYQFGYFVSISSLVTAFAACWLYVTGAGAPPKKGALALIVMIAVGVVAALFAMLASDLYIVIMLEAPDASVGEATQMMLSLLFYGPVWEAFARDAFWFAAFAFVGTASTMMMLAGARDSRDGTSRVASRRDADGLG